MIVDFKNKELKETFNNIVEKFYDLKGDNVYDQYQNYHSAKNKPLEWYASEECLRDFYLPKWEEHDGFPSDYKAVPVNSIVLHSAAPWRQFEFYVRKELVSLVGANRCALFNYYQGDGLTGWHTNWNASGYQIVFSWSPTGDGYFRYLDKEKDKIVTLEDKKNDWVCRYYKFGKINEPMEHCWHAAYTESDRFTICYLFQDDGHKQGTQLELLKDFVYELETP